MIAVASFCAFILTCVLANRIKVFIRGDQLVIENLWRRHVVSVSDEISLLLDRRRGRGRVCLVVGGLGVALDAVDCSEVVQFAASFGEAARLDSPLKVRGWWQTI